MDTKYILALDQGTTSSRSILFDHRAKIVSQAQKEHQQIFPQPGWVEHNAQDIWENQLETAREAINKARISTKQIAAIGITNQRETTVAWSRKTGKPLYNAIVWQDRRTSAYCDSIRKNHETLIKNKTGLPVDAYFSSSKISWLLEQLKHEVDDICFGTIDSWLVWNLAKEHITDVSNASRTSLFNIHTLCWDEELLAIYNIPIETLPRVCESSGILTYCKVNELEQIPICGIAGDQQAALFGQKCWEVGMSKNTYGTGCFFLKNIGEHSPSLNKDYLSTIAWKIAGTTQYAAEGSTFIGGAVVQWLRDSLGIISSSKEVETLANSVKDNGGVYFVPAFTGLGTPYWDQEARGIITGLTRGSNKAHIARAAIESIAFQVAELVEVTGKDTKSLHVDGGAAANNLLMQFQADLLQIPIQRAALLETTALGAAFLAGLGINYWKDKNEIKNITKSVDIFYPKLTKKSAEHLISKWKAAIHKCRTTSQTFS